MCNSRNITVEVELLPVDDTLRIKLLVGVGTVAVVTTLITTHFTICVHTLCLAYLDYKLNTLIIVFVMIILTAANMNKQFRRIFTPHDNHNIHILTMTT